MRTLTYQSYGGSYETEHEWVLRFPWREASVTVRFRWRRRQ